MISGATSVTDLSCKLVLVDMLLNQIDPRKYKVSLSACKEKVETQDSHLSSGILTLEYDLARSDGMQRAIRAVRSELK